MKKAYIENIEKILHQNQAIIVDSFEGCLLDNSLYLAKNGLIALYEEYVNSNASRYLFVFARTEEEQRELGDDFYYRMECALDQNAQ